MTRRQTRYVELQGRSRIATPRWGEAGSSLVPETLRAALGASPLPAWVAEAIGRPDGATVADLDAGVWRTMTAISERLRTYLLALVARPELAGRRVWERPWPLGLVPSMLPLTVRVQNVLGRQELADDVERLCRMTYGELLGVGEIGPATLLELACTADSALNALDHGSPAPPTDVVRSLQAYAFPPWATQVSTRDPRFAALLPPGDGSLRARILDLEARANDYPAARALLRAMPGVERRCNAIAGLSLEDTVDDLIAAATGFPPAVRRAVIDRLGWGGAPQVTLVAAAARVGLHRCKLERREATTRARLFDRETYYFPALDRALDVLAKTAPSSAGEAAAVLAARGISRRPFSVESLRLLASEFGRTIPPVLEALLPRRPPPRSPKPRRKRPHLRLVRSRHDTRR